MKETLLSIGCIIGGVIMFGLMLIPILDHEPQKDNWNNTITITELKVGNSFHTCEVIDKSQDTHSILLKDDTGRMKWFNASDEQFNSYEVDRTYNLGQYDGFYSGVICVGGFLFIILVIMIIIGCAMLKNMRSE
jgi:hypothetical protein